MKNQVTNKAGIRLSVNYLHQQHDQLLMYLFILDLQEKKPVVLTFCHSNSWNQFKEVLILNRIESQLILV